MPIVVKECVKKARDLYQKEDFKKCLETLKAVFEEGDGNTNIACLLLASACYDNLNNEDKAVDMAHKILMLDPKNVQAWLGLSRFCMKNTKRFYMLAVQCFLFLIPYYSSEKNAKKHIECLSKLIQVMVRYQLELPPGLQPLRDICNAVLAGDNANPYALEARLRLMVESALFSPFSEDLDCPQSFTNSFSGISVESVDLELMRDYTDRLGRVLAEGSRTVHLTLALAESFLDTCQFLETGCYEELKKPLSRLQQLSNINVDQRWQSTHSFDVHISALVAIITLSMNDFERCKFHALNLLDFCLSFSAQVGHDIAEFSNFSNVPPSTRTEFMSDRFSYTPVRAFGDTNQEGINPLNRVFNWASCMLLSNAAKSNLKSIIAPSLKYYTTECMKSGEKLIWPRPQTALFIESCIVSDSIGLLPKYVDVFALKSFDIPEEYSIEVSLRIKLVKCLLNFHQPGSDKSAIARDVLSLNNLKGDPGFTSRNHTLAGWILLKVPTVPDEEVLDHFKLGAIADRNYLQNHLYTGETFYSRMKAYRCALRALKTAWDIVPGNPYTAYLLASTLCKLGRPEKAFEVYRRVDTKSFSTPMYFHYGLIALRLKELNKCIPALQRVVAVQPTNVLAWEILAEAYMGRGNYGIALKALKQIIILDPTRPLSHILYAQVYTALSDYPAAIIAYDRVTELLKNQKLHSLHRLANKGLVELNVNLAIQELRSGMSTTAVAHIEAALQIGARVFRETPQNVPQWLWYYMGYSLSLLLVFHDEGLRIRVPKVFMSLFKAPPMSKENEDTCSIGIDTCADLAGIMFTLFIKSSTTAKMQREIVLAWICMGLLQLSRVVHLRTVESHGELVKPLFSAHEEAEYNLTLIQAETCFSIALKESKNLPPNSEQIVAFAWFAMASTLILGRETNGVRSTFAFAMAFRLCSKFLTAGICLASRISSIDYESFGPKVMDRCLDFDPKVHPYWFVMAQIIARGAIIDEGDTKPGQLDEFKCLLKAAEEGFNLDALWHVVPKVFSLLKADFGRNCSNPDKDESLRLARLICAEYLNRCLAFYPNDYRLWHDRGLLLQLSGFYRPAYYCFEKANGLILKLDSKPDSVLITVGAHYLLSAFQLGKVGISELVAFTNLLLPGSQLSSGVHAAVALIQFSLSNFSAAKEALQSVYSVYDLNSSSASYLEVLTAAFIGNTTDTLSNAWDFTNLTRELDFNPNSNPLRCAILGKVLPEKSNSLPAIPLLKGLDAVLDSPTIGYEWLNLEFALSPTLEKAKQVIAMVKTWVYLRPNREALWTLLATAHRLYAGLEIVKKRKEKAKAMESGISCLQSAAAVCLPSPTSEILTRELVNYTNNTVANEQAAFEVLKPLLLRSAVFFPHIQGLPTAINRLCS
nr:tetratricopeptide repeat protein 37 [Hymenolepis microstoma]